MIGSNTLLWIVVIVLLIVVAYLAWRLWRAQSAGQTAPERTDAPAETDMAPTSPARRTSTPPPAWAGKQPQANQTEAPTERRGTPPPSRAGGASAPGGAGGHPQEPNWQVPPRRSKPPPALAGQVPGVAAAPSSSQRRSSGSGARPPAASAGGPRRDDDADPEPARRSTSTKSTDSEEPIRALASVTSWGYQLQDLDINHAAQSPFDLLVIDYSQDGSDEEAYTTQDIARLQRRRAAGRRLVYAYLSVGEAESYRYYWQRSWRKAPPSWLIGENPEWKENYFVRFWDPEWQSIIFAGADSYIDRIAAAGFDGLYLDRCDVYEELQERRGKVSKERDDLEADMVAFIEALSNTVRSRHPHMGIIMQNAELLLAHDEVQAAIDGVAKEELLYGLSRPEKRNTAEEVAESRAMLDLARQAGQPVLAVEYLDKAELRLEATGALRALGYVPYMAAKNRELDKLDSDQPEPAVA